MAKFVINLTWDDAPHLSAEDKKTLLEGYSPHERDARSKGIPQLGSGAIFPVVEDDVVIEPFQLPDHWPRAYALDVGWKRTAAIWGAYDEKTDTWYLYSEYYRGYAEPSVHADAIKARGLWMKGVVDPASRGRSQQDGKSLLNIYSTFGLDLSLANNAVESGLLEVYQRLSTGRIKVFKHLLNWLSEFRVYRRDKTGKVAANQSDHLMDATRYLIMSGRDALEYLPSEDNLQNLGQPIFKTGNSSITGY